MDRGAWQAMGHRVAESWTKHSSTKRNDTNELTKQRTNLQLLGWGEGIFRGFGMDMYTLLYFKRIIIKDLLYSPGNFAQCYVAAWMGGEFGGEWVYVYV